MKPFIRAHTWMSSTDTSVSVPIPAGAQIGDALVLCVIGDFTPATFPPTSSTDFAHSWDQIISNYTDPGASPPGIQGFAINKVATAEDLGSTVSFTCTVNNGLRALVLAIADAAVPVFDWVDSNSFNSSADTQTLDMALLPGLAVGVGLYAKDGSTPVNPAIDRGTTYLSTEDSGYVALVTQQTLTATETDGFITFTGHGIGFGVLWQNFVASSVGSNDDFIDAATVTIADSTDTFYSPQYLADGYTTETGEPLIGGSNPAKVRSGWWRYQPASSGTVTAATMYVAQLTRLDIFSGTRLTGLTYITGVSPSFGGLNDGQVTFAVVAGTTYYLRIAAASTFLTSNGYILRAAGSPSVPTVLPDRLTLWNPTRNSPLTQVDWGEVPPGSSADTTFRVKNLSDHYTATAVNLHLDDGTGDDPQHYLALAGQPFAASVAIGDLPPSAVSPTITLRRVTPSTTAPTIRTSNLRLSATTWTP